MKIIDCPRCQCRIPISEDLRYDPIREIDSQLYAIPEGYSLVRWVPISERKPEEGKEVWIKFPIVDDWYDTQYIPGKLLFKFGEFRWNLFNEQARSIENTQWLEIPK